MSNNPQNLWEVYQLYSACLSTIYSSQQLQRIVNEINSAIFRFLLTEFGFQRQHPHKKMTLAETEAAKAHMKSLPTSLLPQVRTAIEKAFDKLNVSGASRNTYGARINQWVTWAEKESWWPGNLRHQEKFRSQCCPPRASKYGEMSNTSLMPGKGKSLPYGLQPQETPSQLQAQLDEFYEFMTFPNWQGRVIEGVKKSTGQGHLKNIKLFLGWLSKYRSHYAPMVKHELSLSLIFPLVTEEQLEQLTPKQQQKLWKTHKAYLEALICDYFNFLQSVMHSTSPRTRHLKLLSILTLGKFIYRDWVEDKSDYDNIPLLKLVTNLLKREADATKEWSRNRRYVADQSQKWPSVPEGKTALTVVQETVIEPLRLYCRPRNNRGDFRSPQQIAINHQEFLAWVDLGLTPARRQQEARNLRVALCCPVARPADVPANGLYHPLPPNAVRDKRPDGTLEDNYIYKTYTYEGKYYQDGVWVKDIQDYKTYKFHGHKSLIIPNRQFADGSCVYDYIERYLYGWWLPGSYKNSQTYSWWDSGLQGVRGRWVTAGRAEFTPLDTCCLPTNTKSEIWSWGYFFIVPDVGKCYADSTFANFLANSAHTLIGKRITPHTMRYIWATWGFQVGLSDAQLRSLADAMGSTLETLRSMYERCTPSEKRRLIKEAIDELLFPDAGSDDEAVMTNAADLQGIFQSIQSLSDQQRSELIKMLKSS
ncbi:hypothetical protein [Nostoc parmelioides]|uniref:Integrase n=1 Tax=Nostoc parmelioides FACHB-3921 TaxID=2692909 RepID=A0ABR8BQ69_9NOSO|nr:hypothetical protein [Nostoc parmelioides]MBD2255464.1 hypothetical protein [Nostoc parmelioides FACHB-3921]